MTYTAKYSYSCMLTYYRKNEFVENVWPANSSLFIYVSTHCVETVKKLDNNRYKQKMTSILTRTTPRSCLFIKSCFGILVIRKTPNSRDKKLFVSLALALTAISFETGTWSSLLNDVPQGSTWSFGWTKEVTRQSSCSKSGVYDKTNIGQFVVKEHGIIGIVKVKFIYAVPVSDKRMVSFGLICKIKFIVKRRKKRKLLKSHLHFFKLTYVFGLYKTLSYVNSAKLWLAEYWWTSSSDLIPLCSNSTHNLLNKWTQLC